MLKVVAIGKMKNKHLAALASDYTERLSHYGTFELAELKDSDPDKETLRMQENLKNFRGKIYAMTEEGKPMTSKELSKLLERDLLSGGSAFIIGGPYGLSESMRKTACLISLSPMTFTHEMARVILLEQLYRAKTISSGTGYHH